MSGHDYECQMYIQLLAKHDNCYYCIQHQPTYVLEPWPTL